MSSDNQEHLPAYSSAYRAYSPEEEDTPTPGSPAAQGEERKSTEANIIQEKPLLIDILLPVPVTTTNQTSSPQASAIRRITALGVIIVFLLTITFYGTALVDSSNDPVEMHTAVKSVVGGLVNSVGGSLKGVQDVSDKMNHLELGNEGEDAKEEAAGTSEDVAIWGDAPKSEITLQSMEGLTSDGVTTASGPDWAKYTFLRTLPPSALELGKPKRRLIFVGDIHSSYRPLKKLMKKLSFDPSHDKLIHVGDVIAKGPEPHAVLDYLRTNHAKGVRGNHDEKAIEWRTWMRWAGKGYQTSDAQRRRDGSKKHTGWRAFLDDLDAQFPPNAEDDELSESQQQKLQETLAAKSKSFPKDWSWRSEHWRIARDLSKENYQYLVDLPLTLHIPSIHSIVVHAGLLARDPTKKATAEDRPFAISAGSNNTEQDISIARTQAEIALLRTIPQNKDPYTLLNIRSVLKDGEVTKKANKGTPWSDMWNEEMSRCTHFESTVEEEGEEKGSTKDDAEIEAVEGNERRLAERKKGPKTLPKMNCSPVTVIYGHAAGRGLDIKPYSKGLDSGCVYGKQLTALVLGDIKATKEIKGAKPVRVGSGKKNGILIDIECDKATSGKPE